MTFQKTVMTVALVLFIIIMAVVVVLMNKAKKTRAFPPETGVCPDYWELTNIQGPDGDIIGCKDTKKVGNQKDDCGTGINFADAIYKTKKQKCMKAKDCGVEWDGITNMGLC